MVVRRSFVSRVRSRRPSGVPAIVTPPPSGRSRPAAICIKVDLPEPDGPMTAVNVPAGNTWVTPRRASTVPERDR
nr:hypothetical protein GCM10025730_00040 [Promicromonospora thailandica]